LRGKSRLETLVQAPGVERNPAIAPNGRFIAYNSDESGRPEVYVRPFPDAGTRRWQVSTDGGAGPAWTRGGKEIVFSASQGRVMAAAVHTDSNDAFIVSKPEPLFTFGRDMGRGVTRGFDVTADGQRFVFVVPNRTAGSEQAVELTLIQHWVDELTRLVPREP
jgi:dipeptidyl aminopeptidase/acylaminoacyl peptidase